MHGCSAQKLVRTQHILGCFGNLSTRVLLSSGVSPTETSEDNECKQFLVNITSITPPNRPFTRLPIVLLRLPHTTPTAVRPPWSTGSTALAQPTVHLPNLVLHRLAQHRRIGWEKALKILDIVLAAVFRPGLLSRAWTEGIILLHLGTP